MANENYAYVGEELELFQHAVNWKAYLRRQIAPYLQGHVLEVGAGIGGTTRLLRPGHEAAWTCLEPDATMASRLTELSATGQFGGACDVSVGTVADLPDSPGFDTLIYIDVLEHIEDDARELAWAARRLRPEGRVIVLSPAHQWLYCAFDAALGHYRRYSRTSLPQNVPGLKLDCVRYLDSVGQFASVGNRLVLRSSLPTLRQIRTWDRLMVPISRIVDPLLGYRAGKSILAVWQKTAHDCAAASSRLAA